MSQFRPFDSIRASDDTAVEQETTTELRKPPMYKVFLLNDDYTPMDFVVTVLQRFFQKGVEEATSIMLAVHHEGRGLCGIYPHDIAESKIALVTSNSRRSGHPLLCVMEEEDAQ